MLAIDNRRGLKDRVTTSPRSDVVTALDVGTTKVSCFIAKVEVDNPRERLPVRVVGIGHQLSLGMRKGAVTDMDQMEDAIRAAVEAAERMAGTTIRRVVVNLTAGHPASQTISVGASVAGRPIRDDDLKRLLRYGRKQCQPEDRTIVHAIPTSYSIDGNHGIQDPRGMFGERLGVLLHVVSAATAPLQNLALSVQRCHLDVSHFVASPYASGLSCLVDDEKDLGVICVDMGGGTTSMSVFAEGTCLHTDVVSLGGIQVTNDIARGLSTPVASAERIKTLYGSALAGPTDDREMIDVPLVGEEGNSTNRVPRSLLIGVIQPRLEEIFELVRDRLADSGLENAIGKRLVLTGGGSQLTGVRELAARIFEKNVRLGRPLKLLGLADAAGGPAFSTCAGLLNYAASSPAEALRTEPEVESPTAIRDGQIAKIGRWLKMNF